MSQLSSRFTLSNALLRLPSSYAAADAFCAASAMKFLKRSYQLDCNAADLTGN